MHLDRQAPAHHLTNLRDEKRPVVRAHQAARQSRRAVRAAVRDAQGRRPAPPPVRGRQPHRVGRAGRRPRDAAVGAHRAHRLRARPARPAHSALRGGDRAPGVLPGRVGAAGLVERPAATRLGRPADAGRAATRPRCLLRRDHRAQAPAQGPRAHRGPACPGAAAGRRRARGVSGDPDRAVRLRHRRRHRRARRCDGAPLPPGNELPGRAPPAWPRGCWSTSPAPPPTCAGD